MHMGILVLWFRNTHKPVESICHMGGLDVVVCNSICRDISLLSSYARQKAKPPEDVEATVNNVTLIPESQFGRITLLSLSGGGIFALIALWEWHILIAAIILSLSVVYILIRFYMLLSIHQLELEERKREMNLITPIVPHTPALVQQLAPPKGRWTEDNDYIDEEEEPVQEAPKTFRELIDQGYVKPGGDFVLGFSPDGKPINLESLTSLGIGGFQGSGKTVTTLVLLLQAIAKYEGRIKFLIIDPHMHVSGQESLASKVSALNPFFLTVQDVLATIPQDDRDYRTFVNRCSNLTNPLEGGEEARAWMKIMWFEMDRRKKGKTGETWVVVIDEAVTLFDDPKIAVSISNMIQDLNRQARKMNMFTLVISQEWKGSRVGGTDLRHSIATLLLHSMPQDVAGLLVPDDIARKVPKLERGQIIMYSRGIEKSGSVPYADARDAELIVDSYLSYRDFMIEEELSKTQTQLLLPPVDITLVEEEIEEVKEKEEIPEDFMQSELEEVRKLYVSGLSVANIAKAVYGVKSGPELERAKIDVEKQVRWLVGRTLC